MTGLRIIVTLAVLVNLILTVAVITQIRDVQQRVASLPPDLARSLAALPQPSTPHSTAPAGRYPPPGAR